MYKFTMSASVSLEAILHNLLSLIYQRLASLWDLFGSLRKPTERAEEGPGRQFATTNPPPRAVGKAIIILLYESVMTDTVTSSWS